MQLQLNVTFGLLHLTNSCASFRPLTMFTSNFHPHVSLAVELQYCFSQCEDLCLQSAAWTRLQCMLLRHADLIQLSLHTIDACPVGQHTFDNKVPKTGSTSQYLVYVADGNNMPLPGPPGAARPSPSSDALPGPPDARVLPPGQLSIHSPCCPACSVLHCRCWLSSLMHSIQSGLVCKQKGHGNVNWACLLHTASGCISHDCFSDWILNFQAVVALAQCRSPKPA